MKILFAARGFQQFYNSKSLVAVLLSRGHKLQLIIDRGLAKDSLPEETDLFHRHFPDIRLDTILNRKDLWRFILFPAREILSYRRYLLFPEQSIFYRDRWLKHLPFGLRFLIKVFPSLNFLIKKERFGIMLRKVEDLAPPNYRISDYLRKFNPDLVIASPADMWPQSVEVEFLKAARFLKIPTVLTVPSSDNLTTKGVVYIKPDLVLAWNNDHQEELWKRHEIPKDRIKIVGAMVFDRWFSDIKSSTRSEFCGAHNLKSEDPIILYLGSTKGMAEDETWLIKELRQALDESTDNRLRKVQMIVRPHPANKKFYKELAGEKGILVLSEESSYPNSPEELRRLYDTFYHSVAVVGVYTSGMIDAMILDKPVIAFLAKRYEPIQARAKHFGYLSKRDLLELVHTPGEFVMTVDKILNGKDNRQPQRKSFIQNFIRPRSLNMAAGEVAAEEIEKLFKK